MEASSHRKTSQKQCQLKLFLGFVSLLIVFLIFTLIIGIFTRSKSPPKCIAPMSHWNGSCYHILLEKIPCMYLRPTADRVTIESTEELEFLEQLVQSLGLASGTGFWTAGDRFYDPEEEVDFIWDYPYSRDPRNLTYVKWLKGSPGKKTAQDEKNCLKLLVHQRGLWMKEANCFDREYQICERAYNETIDGVSE